jgi:hypothetical protein
MDAIYVVHTALHETLAALRVAGDFARALSVPLTVIQFRTGTHDAVLHDAEGMSRIHTEGIFTRLRAENPDIRGRVYVCSNERRAIPLAFRPQSLIVIAGRRSWWPTQSERWRRMLEAAGQFVVFVDTSEQKEALHA